MQCKTCYLRVCRLFAFEEESATHVHQKEKFVSHKHPHHEHAHELNAHATRFPQLKSDCKCRENRTLGILR